MAEYIGHICPGCKTPLKNGDTVVFCSNCNAPQHLSCWQQKQGCSTPNCTGIIREIVGMDSHRLATPAGPTSATPATRTPEKPIEVIHEVQELTFQEDIPVVLEKVALIMDHSQSKLFARCNWRNISDKIVRAVQAELLCQDVWGSPLGDPIPCQYLDLKAKRDAKFGQAVPIELPDSTVRQIQVNIQKVVFADNSLITGGNHRWTMAAPVPLLQHLGSNELVNEYHRQTSTQGQFVPTFTDAHWRCTCGALNDRSEANCHLCGCSQDALANAPDAQGLNAIIQERLEEKRIAEEKARAEAAERQRLQAEKARQEREEQEKRIQEMRENARKRRRKRLITASIIVSLMLVITAACLTVFVGIPYYNYQNACELLSIGQFDEARQAFLDLDGFMNSEEMASYSLYQKAKAALETERYDDARTLFLELGDYMNSPDMANEALYRKAQDILAAKNYDQAKEIFLSLGDYKDSAAMAKEATYRKAEALLDANAYNEARTLFLELGNYSNSADMAKEATYRKATYLFEQKRYQEAHPLFISLGNYSNSASNAQECLYQQAQQAMDSKKYEQAYQLFKSLGSYSNSYSKAKECQYQQALILLGAGQTDRALSILEQLGNYKDSASRVSSLKYQKAQNYLNAQNYQAAYHLFVELGSYSTSKDDAAKTLSMWIDAALSSKSLTQASTLANSVSLNSSQYQSFLDALVSYINKYPDRETWENGNNATTVSNIQTLLKELPYSYKNVSQMTKLFNLLAKNPTDYKTLAKSNSSVIEDCWSLLFVQDMVQHDDAICYFLKGTWKTADKEYKLEFYESGSAVSCRYNLPHPTKPSSANYYDIESMVWYWEDSSGRKLDFVYRFEIVDYDTIRVYCYRNGLTYTLYRQ